MVRLNSLPDPKHYQPGKDTAASIRATTLIDTTLFSGYCYPEHYSPLGIISNPGGSANYTINNRHYRLSDSYFFIMNRDSRIAIDIQTKKPIDVVYLFFDPEICNSIVTASKIPFKTLLDEPFIKTNASIGFTERLHHKQEADLGCLLHEIRKSVEDAMTEELIFRLFAKLTSLNEKNRKELDCINAVKASTRAEIYFRLYNAKFFIDENYASSITLKDIAQHAMLNSYHLLRLFKQVFGVTPHAYLTTVRLKSAEHLLKNTSIPVTNICFSTGFESLGSFSLLFKKYYMDAPAFFRKKYKR